MKPPKGYINTPTGLAPDPHHAVSAASNPSPSSHVSHSSHSSHIPQIAENPNLAANSATNPTEGHSEKKKRHIGFFHSYHLFVLLVVVVAAIIGLINGAINGFDSSDTTSSSHGSSAIPDVPAPTPLDTSELPGALDLSYAENSEWVVGNQFMGSTGAKTSITDIAPIVSECQQVVDDDGHEAIACILTWTNTTADSLDTSSKSIPSIEVVEKSLHNPSISEEMKAAQIPDSALGLAPDSTATPVEPGKKHSQVFTFERSDQEGNTPANVYIQLRQQSTDGEYLYTTIGILDTTTMQVNQTKGATVQ